MCTVYALYMHALYVHCVAMLFAAWIMPDDESRVEPREATATACKALEKFLSLSWEKPNNMCMLHKPQSEFLLSMMLTASYRPLQTATTNYHLHVLLTWNFSPFLSSQIRTRALVACPLLVQMHKCTTYKCTNIRRTNVRRTKCTNVNYFTYSTCAQSVQHNK